MFNRGEIFFEQTSVHWSLKRIIGYLDMVLFRFQDSTNDVQNNLSNGLTASLEKLRNGKSVKCDLRSYKLIASNDTLCYQTFFFTS